MVLSYLRTYFPEGIYMALYIQSKCMYLKENRNYLVSYWKGSKVNIRQHNHHNFVSKVYGIEFILLPCSYEKLESNYFITIFFLIGKYF